MHANNLVVLRGRVSGAPQLRSLPSGAAVVNFELSTLVDGLSITVPIAVEAESVDCELGDHVVVTGHIRRRFFRVGGVTQSRTEVVGTTVLRETRRKAVERALEQAGELLAG
jgi:single-strand DNA-binding protein